MKKIAKRNPIEQPKGGTRQRYRVIDFLGAAAKYELSNPDAGSVITNFIRAKILPGMRKDAASGSLHAYATIAAMDLPGWADTIAHYAREADNPKYKAGVKEFFIELGKALQNGRRLWDTIDRLIITNYHASERFPVPLCEMTEAHASKVIGLTPGAYDKRLLRLGIRKDRVGRPSKHDKKSR